MPEKLAAQTCDTFAQEATEVKRKGKIVPPAFLPYSNCPRLFSKCIRGEVTDRACDGVAKLPRPRPAPHKRVSRPAPNIMGLFY